MKQEPAYFYDFRAYIECDKIKAAGFENVFILGQ